MRTNPDLAVWQAICAAPVVGAVGHRRTQAPGPAHPTRHPPAWVTPHGCDLALLHVAHIAHVVHDRRGEDRECTVGHARPMRRVRRHPRPVALRVVKTRRVA